MSFLCRIHLHDFADIDLGRDFGHALECRRCRYQVRDRVVASRLTANDAIQVNRSQSGQ